MPNFHGNVLATGAFYGAEFALNSSIHTWSMSTNDNGEMVIRDELNGVDVLTLSPGSVFTTGSGVYVPLSRITELMSDIVNGTSNIPTAKAVDDHLVDRYLPLSKVSSAVMNNTNICTGAGIISYLGSNYAPISGSANYAHPNGNANNVFAAASLNADVIVATDSIYYNGSVSAINFDMSSSSNPIGLYVNNTPDTGTTDQLLIGPSNVGNGQRINPATNHLKFTTIGSIKGATLRVEDKITLNVNQSHDHKLTLTCPDGAATGAGTLVSTEPFFAPSVTLGDGGGVAGAGDVLYSGDLQVSPPIGLQLRSALETNTTDMLRLAPSNTGTYRIDPDYNYLKFRTWGGSHDVLLRGEDKLFLVGGSQTWGSAARITLSQVNSSARCTIEANVTYTGTLTQSSDVRLKSNMSPIHNALTTLRKLTPCVFNKSGEPDAGFIAQSIEEVPELSKYVTTQESGMKALNYCALFTHAVAALQQVDVVVRAQSSQIKNLIDRVSALEGQRPPQKAVTAI